MSLVPPTPLSPLPVALSALPFEAQVLDAIPFSVSVSAVINDTEFRIVFNNRACREAYAATAVESIGKQLKDVVGPAEAIRLERNFHQCMAEHTTILAEASYQLPTGTMWAITRYTPMHDSAGQITHIVSIWEDITERKARELQEQQQQAQVIQQQAAQLMEVSTPILSISETTVVVPLIGTVDSYRVQQIMQALLNGVSERRARVVIVDITGVMVVDTAVANALLQASQAVRLLGAQVVLTGIRPEVAQTLVGLGVDISAIITLGTLRDGIAYALKA